MNYDELVKALRNNADHYAFTGDNGLVHLLTNAADAIEELQAEYNELLFRCGQAEALIDFYQQMPKEDEA